MSEEEEEEKGEEEVEKEEMEKDKMRRRRGLPSITETWLRSGGDAQPRPHFPILSLVGSCVGVGACNLIMLIYMLLCWYVDSVVCITS